MSDAQRPDQSSLVQSGNRRLTTQSSTLVRRGLETLLAQQKRVIHFPSDRSMGTLLIRNKGTRVSEEELTKETWGEELGEACGDIRIDGEKELCLIVREEDLSPLSALKPEDLYKISFFDVNVCNAELMHLQGLTGIQALDFYNDNSQVNDTGLVYLQVLTALQALGLSRTEVSDVGLAYLQGLTTLQELDLSETQVGDVGLLNLQGLTALQKLDLSNTNISDMGLVHLQGLTALQKLDLRNTNISDAGLVYLLGMTKLQTLALSHIDRKVRNEGSVLFLTRWEAFRSIAARNKDDDDFLVRNGNISLIGDEGLVYLRNLTALQVLDLLGTQVSDAGLFHLRGLTTLQELNLAYTQVSDAGLFCLQELLALRRLHLSGTQVTDVGVGRLQRVLPNCHIKR